MGMRVGWSARRTGVVAHALQRGCAGRAAQLEALGAVCAALRSDRGGGKKNEELEKEEEQGILDDSQTIVISHTCGNHWLKYDSNFTAVLLR